MLDLWIILRVSFSSERKIGFRGAYFLSTYLVYIYILCFVGFFLWGGGDLSVSFSCVLFPIPDYFLVSDWLHIYISFV